MSNISNKIEQISKNWEDFKQQNEARLQQIETKNAADPITTHQLNKISDTIDRYHAQMNFASAGSRPLSSVANEVYAFNNSDKKYQKAFGNYVRKGLEDEMGSCTTNSCPAGDGRCMLFNYK